MWEITDATQIETLTHFNKTSEHLHIYHIMYSKSTFHFAKEHSFVLDFIIAEIRRMIIKKRVQRLTGRNTGLNNTRIKQHIYIFTNSLQQYLLYLGKDTTFIEQFNQTLINQM